MNHLWAPWRGEYIESNREKDPKACVFCTLRDAPHDAAHERESLLLYRNEHAFVLMNRFPYNNGHLLVLPTQHTGRFDGLNPDAFSALHTLLAACSVILEKAIRAEGVNLGMNMGAVAGAGIPQHMHYHLVPRWFGDTNFMPVIGETKVISQHILHTYDTLLSHFKTLKL